MNMKFLAKVETEVEAAAIRLVLPVEYDDEDMPDDYPHRKNDTWDVTVDIGTGQIRDWPAGGYEADLDLYMKVADAGSYYLLDDSGKVLGKIEEYYVPKCIPGEYGDYVDFKIDKGGRITNWKLDPDKVADCFFGDDED